MCQVAAARSAALFGRRSRCRAVEATVGGERHGRCRRRVVFLFFLFFDGKAIAQEPREEGGEHLERQPYKKYGAHLVERPLVSIHAKQDYGKNRPSYGRHQVGGE